MTPTLADLLDLTGRTAIVTGGAMGIGRAIAERLAEAGAAVVIADADGEAAETLAKELTERGNAIAPGAIATPGVARIQKASSAGGVDQQAMLQEFLAKIPMGRMARPRRTVPGQRSVVLPHRQPDRRRRRPAAVVTSGAAAPCAVRDGDTG